MTTTTARCMVVRMESTGRKITIAREAMGWNQSELARALKVTPQSVQAWESGRNTPRPKRLQEIAEKLGVSAGYLMGDDAQTQAIANVKPGPDIKGRVPLISWVQAGDWCEAIDSFAPGDAEEWLPCPFEHSDSAFCLEVVGLSMFPDYREREIIAVDPGVDATHGSDVVCRTPGGNVTFKRLQITPDGTYLLALNPDWPDRMIVIPEGTRICGVVIGSWMRRR